MDPHDARDPHGTAPAAPARRPARRADPVWALAAASCAAAVGLLYTLLVTTSTGQLLEYQLFAAVEDRWGVPAVGLAPRLVRLLPPALAVGAGLAALACLPSRRTRGRGVLALVALVGANATTQVLKHVLPRPALENGVPWAGGNSLPSGHTTLVAAAAATVLLLVPSRWRPAAAVAGAAATAFTGAAAYLEAWHRPSDMAAAVAVAGLWAVLVAPWRRGPRAGRRRASALERTVEALLWAAGLGGLAAGGVLLALTLSAPAVAGAAHPLAAVGGVLLSASPAAVLVGLLLSLLRRMDARRIR